ncbi:MAG: PmbA protein [Gaiellaceae bacterium]|nr:PmbA protein [Gaiellaceae bacterium]
MTGHAREAAEQALAAAGEDEAEAVALGERSGLARFASSEVHQPTLIENLVVTLRVVRGGRVGLAVTNRVDEKGLRELAVRARETADSTVAEPNFPGLADPAPVPEVEGYDAATAAVGPEEQARAAAAAIDAVDDAGLYGFYTSGVTELAVVSTTGVTVEQEMTDVTALVLAAGEGMSGYAEQTSWRASDVDPAAVAHEAAEKARRTRDAKPLEPGAYRAVLEPYAFADLLEYFAYDSLGALGLLEERSYFSGRLGEKLFDEKVTIVDDALDPLGLTKAFDFEGVPKQRVPLVADGVACGVVWDRTTAGRAESGQATTGHAPPPLLQEYGPLPFALEVDAGEAGSVEELVELVGDGIYITRLHYLGVVHPREGVITGMTRDGTFRIRDGKIAEPLVNLRFTVSVPRMLEEVPGLTRARTLVNASDFYGERYPFGTLVPALATARFTITGTGSGPGI